MKKGTLLAIMIFFTMQAFAGPDTSNQKNLSSALEGILAKTGLSFGGEFRSQYLSSEIGDTGAVKSKRSFESTEFTSVDFDIKARPNTVTQGRLILRMHQDWRNFYSDISNPIHTRWLSIDGSIKRMFSYNVGDFKQKFTSLTLYSPDLEILYEPELFKKEAEVAKKERFLEDNQRILQGVNCNFAAEVVPVFNSLRVNILGARLRSPQTNIKNGDLVTTLIEDTLAEKFLGATNIDATFLKAFSLGGNFLTFFDNRASFYSLTLPNGSFVTPPLSDTMFDTIAVKTAIYDVRGGVDIAELLNGSTWKASLNAEMAFSNDDSAYYRVDSVMRDTVRVARKTLAHKNIPGNAFRGGLTAAYTGSDLFSIGLSATFLNTAKDYRNELAQSPSFIGRRIMNIENDTPFTSRNNFDVNSLHYSSFDAMYGNVFKFTPSASSNRFFMAPFSKNSYYSTVYSYDELMRMQAARIFDPSLQLIMPFGPATPNRTGIDASVNLGFLGNQIEAKVVLASLKEIEGVKVSDTVSFPVTSFSKVGGGAKVALDKFIGWQYPFYISGSLVNSSADNAGISNDSLRPELTTTSAFYCGDLYFKFWKRAALIGGVELIDNEFASTYTAKTTQIYYAGGLEYKVAEGSYVHGKIGQIRVSYDSDVPVVTGQPTVAAKNFSQAIVNLFLTVKF